MGYAVTTQQVRHRAADNPPSGWGPKKIQYGEFLKALRTNESKTV